MLFFDNLILLVMHLNGTLTKEQRKAFMCDYKDIDKIPKEIRYLIANNYLSNESITKTNFEASSITNTDDMVDSDSILSLIIFKRTKGM